MTSSLRLFFFDFKEVPHPSLTKFNYFYTISNKDLEIKQLMEQNHKSEKDQIKLAASKLLKLKN